MSKTPKSDASYEKLKSLRDSGYKGAVDQDGNKVADVDEWIKDNRTTWEKG